MIAWQVQVLGNEAILGDERIANTRNLGEAIYRTNGLPEVDAGWVAANVGRFRLVDVREAGELAAHGRVPQAEHALATFMSTADGLDRAAPLVVMCASGNRSGRVVRALEAAGFSAVASMEGGMFGKGHGLPCA
ncbi:MAG: rhodanese-like domain-containing protein [Myxococcota bacterium]